MNTGFPIYGGLNRQSRIEAVGFEARCEYTDSSLSRKAFVLRDAFLW